MHRTRQNLDDLESPSTQPVENRAYLARLKSSSPSLSCWQSQDIGCRHPACRVCQRPRRPNWWCDDTDHTCQPPSRRLLLPSPADQDHPSFLSHRCSPLIVRALIHARVDYCNGLLASCPKYLTDKLQSVLRAAARLVLQLPYRSSVTDLMHRQLHWLDIRSRVRFKISLLVFKCLHGLAPRYLSDFCVPVPVSSTRSSCVQPGSRSVFSSSRERELKQSVIVASSMRRPLSGNLLPDDLRDPELSIGCFRNKLKTFLFSQIWCLLELVVLYSHFVFFLIMSIVCRVRQRDILLAGAFKMSWLIDWRHLLLLSGFIGSLQKSQSKVVAYSVQR